MKLRLVQAWQSVRGSYWFVPALMAIAAGALAYVTLWADDIVSSEQITGFGWLYTGGASGARAVLSAVVQSTITVTGTVFSITIAVLVLASNQFGPRLLRTFMRDSGNQVVLGTFIATFVYCLLILRQVRDLDDNDFVPYISVTTGSALAIVAIGVLIYFIHHIARSIQAPNVIATAAGELDGAIKRLFPEMIGEGEDEPETPPAGQAVPQGFERGSGPIAATRSGYLVAVDGDRLLTIAGEHDVIVRLDRRPGQFVVEGQNLVTVWPKNRITPDLSERICGAFLFGNERTPSQDVGFAFSQVVEIAVRALSPSLNDPFTAITCIDRLSAGLCMLAQRRTPSPFRFDDQQKLRVIAEPDAFPEMADIAFNQIRQYGASSVAVMSRMLEAIRTVATCAGTHEQRLVLLRHAEMVHRTGIEHAPDEWDRAALAKRYDEVRHVLGPLM
jgi:uncharacterized membrane protein